MSHSNSTFKRNQIVQAFWPEDSKWYPARVLKVKPNDVFRIQFSGYVEEYDFHANQLRDPKLLVRGPDFKVPSLPNHVDSKETASQPAPAPAPISKPSAQEPQAHAKDAAPASTRENIRVRVCGRGGGHAGSAPSQRRNVHFTKQQDPDSSSQMQREQCQAAATVADLQDQVQRLASELSSSQATLASSRSEAESARAQMQRERSQAAATVADLQDQVQRLASELSSSHAAAQEQLRVSFDAILESQRQCFKSAAAQHLQHHAHAAAANQDDNRSIDDAAYGPVSQKLQDSSNTGEQLRRTLVVQHCGS